MPEIYLAGLNLLIQNPVELILGNIANLNVPLSYWNGIFTYETVGAELRFFVSLPNEGVFNLNLAGAILQANSKPLYLDALEQLALFEELFVDHRSWKIEVLLHAWKVGETHIQEFDVIVFDVLDDFRR